MSESGTDDRADLARARAHAALTAYGRSGRHPDLVSLPAGWGWTQLWRAVDRDGRALVLRVFPGPAYGDGARVAAEREAAAHASARAVGVPAPEVLAVVDLHLPGEGSAPSVAMVTEFAPGLTLGTHLRQHPEDAFELGRQCGAVLSRLSRASVPAVVAERSWRDWPSTDALGEAVRERLPTGVTEGLLHLDLHPENVLVTRPGGAATVSAVLDWANARSGPPAADLARSLAIVELVRARPDLLDSTAALDAYADGLVDGSGGQPPATELGWWALAVQIDDLAPIATRPGGWLQAADVAAWRHQLRQRLELPD